MPAKPSQTVRGIFFQIESSRSQLLAFSNIVAKVVTISVNSRLRTDKEKSGLITLLFFYFSFKTKNTT